MAKRSIIRIDEGACNGCGECIPNCPEGALQVIDGKARLISDLFCDGLGACIGHCPRGAITVEEREAEPYDEERVMENIVRQGPAVIKAHLEHLSEHGESVLLQKARAVLKKNGIADPFGAGRSCPSSHGGSVSGGCPGAAVRDLRTAGERSRFGVASAHNIGKGETALRQWPVQLSLVPALAPYLEGADLLIAADCVPFAYPDFHRDFLQGRIVLVGCPKLDDTQAYAEKLQQIFTHNGLRSITYVHMEVPCCGGLIGIIRSALQRSGKDIPFQTVTVRINGEAAVDG